MLSRVVSRWQSGYPAQQPRIVSLEIDSLEQRRVAEETFQIAPLYGLSEPTMLCRVPLGGPSGTTKV